ncbi:MAG: hypothetical protein WAW06_05140 [bacterium]
MTTTDHRWRVLAAITGIVILETVALLTRVDGKCFGIAVAAVAGLGGFSLAQVTRRNP